MKEYRLSPDMVGGFDEYDNGNGSLMRILPLLFYLLEKPVHDNQTGLIDNTRAHSFGHRMLLLS